MAWQILAMWLIVVVTIIWFIRDERRLRAEARLEADARYYAHAPRFRHVSPAPLDMPPAPRPRLGGLTEQQRKVFEALLRKP